ncbi:MAG: NUDIX domain-containing protein [bacterium]|nr:NUDIX domain-containing protein [bacterium]
MEIKQFTATKGFIVHEGKILIVRESGEYKDGINVKKYGVPGGRINPGERFDDCLRREVMEEAGLKITIGRPFFVSEWRPVVRGENWQITAIFFECFAENNDVKLSSDHDDFQWISPEDYKNYALIDDEIKVFEEYLKFIKNGN